MRFGFRLLHLEFHWFVAHTAGVVGESCECILEFSYMRIILIWSAIILLTKCQGFYLLFCRKISANFLDNSCETPYTSYVINDKEREYERIKSKHEL